MTGTIAERLSAIVYSVMQVSLPPNGGVRRGERTNR